MLDSKGSSYASTVYELMDYNPFDVSYYRLNAVDKDGKADFSHVINVRRSDVLGKISLAPNPASNAISIQTSCAFEEIGKISVIDMTGRIVKNENRSLIKGLNTINIDLTDLKAGLYLFSIQTEEGLRIEKFVKQ